MITIKPRAFFFDFDGVIFDTEKLHWLAARDALKSQKINLSKSYFFKDLFSLDDKTLFKQILSDKGRSETRCLINHFLSEKNKSFMKLIEASLRIYPGVRPLLTQLKKRKIPMAVVSGALAQEVLTSLKQKKLPDFFEFIVCADDVTHCKPHPEPYNNAFAQMRKIIPDLKKEDCWILEDSPIGIESAAKAGMNTIGITNTTTKKRLAQAMHVIQGYGEIRLL